MRKFVKNKKYQKKGPSIRIKKPVKPIKKSVVDKSGKYIERTYYTLTDKNKKLIRKKNNNIENNIKNSKNKLSFVIDKFDFKKSNKRLIEDYKKDKEILTENNMKDEDWLFLAKNEDKIKNAINHINKNTENKFEMIVGLDKNMDLSFNKKGKEKEIELTDEEVDKLRNHKLTIHNHPSETPFSMEDLWMFVKFGHNKGIVNSNNELFYVNLEDNKNTYTEYKRMWNDSLWDAREKMDKLVDDGVYDLKTQMDIINIHFNKIAFDIMSKRYNLRYVNLKHKGVK